ncbi:actin cytoskeleton-regulatory complex protein pan1-like [Triticum dicoccoides]|uniref:actin cytoskeleton-regulatory complex protein pan1-like n=1 Tax=Triticum dicoccoides TaxID=85692 RepID=UPI00162EA3CB|nr:actin cytoskeleton-regulatory complex protein pan1-like [Triticum dicoccoides]
MTPPFRPSPSSTAPAPRGCGGERCASGREAWPLHHVRHNDVFCRLCSSCVLLYHPASFCSACLLLLHTDAAAAAAAAQDPHFDPAVAPPGPTAECSNCGLFVAHVTCIPDPVSFVCPPCAAEAEGRPFTYAPAARRVMDERAARILLIAARLAHESIGRAAAAAREEAERRVQEAAVARKRSREMLDAAFRALEEEARAAKIKEEEEAAREAKNKKEKPAAAQPPKKKTPKSSESSRDRDKMLKFNAMQQPALAFAAAAAAAASSCGSSMPPLSTPPPKEDKKPMKQEEQGSTDTVADEDVKGLFGTLQS